MNKILVSIGAFFAAALVSQASLAGDDKLGEKVFKKCKSCHLVGENAKNRVGPQLNDLFGRSAGSLEGYKYSKAMSAKLEEGLVWEDETLTAFLTAPKKNIPGTKMSFRGFKKSADIENLLAYLKRFSKPGSN